MRTLEQQRLGRDVPAAVQYIGPAALQRFGPASVVSAVNTTPGVRMEERSPGSYRINIRGSALRSPFGVRNVKVYFNDLPITDPGGHTHLNALGYYNIHHLEVLRGPGSSLYGAGTGGALLIESLGAGERPGLMTEYTAGSYGGHNAYGRVLTGNDDGRSKVGFQHQESAGYRTHSALRRNVLSWSGQFGSAPGRVLKTTFLFSDLHYQTPGALTEAEFRQDPRGARPGGGAFPGAVAAGAAVRQQGLLAGLSYEVPLLPRLRQKIAAYGAFTELRNPNIRAYDRSLEPHGGLRSTLQYEVPVGSATLRLDGGTEWQQGQTSVSIYKNSGGHADSLRTSDEIRNQATIVFLQAVVDAGPWTMTAGGSFNNGRVRFQRFGPGTPGPQARSFRQWAPRVALLRKLGPVNVYTAWSKGFSPPTTAELLPTGGAINPDLQPEQGNNFEAGVKGALGHRLSFDVTAFTFALRQSIVQRRTAGGGDYFVNAGRTRQQGLETSLRWALPRGFFSPSSVLWASHTWHRFRYADFKQVNNDYSGNALPGVAPHTVAAGADLWWQERLFLSATYFYSARLPLNDANSAWAPAYHLVGARVGWQGAVGARVGIKVSAGADNLLNERYSLGNDVNGFGGRYYNAAPGRNYFVSVQVERWFRKRE
ncbi:TonB-dependent receptor [Flaviaesturariibacter amylovorans]|uniref:TonB-dependent receptor n=1 Tax=Flaviaesturariibacter amylovorans TaxID=1084520 RepID=A0ABP8HVL2_9BACT